MNDYHYFANHALGWAIAETEEQAIEKLLLQNTDPHVLVPGSASR
jgi:hypothetical protein